VGPVTASKDGAPAADQADITYEAGVMKILSEGGLIYTTSG
jgi:hypothetical protein